MSLINDALKRAKQSQGQAGPTPAPQLHFRPVEAERAARRGLGILLPVTFAIIALLGLVFIWELAHQRADTNPQSEMVARAASTQPPLAAPPPVPITAHPAPAVVETAPAPSIAPEPAVVATVPTPAETVPAPPAPESIPDAPPAPPKPAPLRLQGIIFHPSRPSAMINNKSVFVGDKVGEFRVGQITQDSATLINISSGQTNVLNLAQ